MMKRVLLISAVFLCLGKAALAQTVDCGPISEAQVPVQFELWSEDPPKNPGAWTTVQFVRDEAGATNVWMQIPNTMLVIRNSFVDGIANTGIQSLSNGMRVVSDQKYVGIGPGWDRKSDANYSVVLTLSTTVPGQPVKSEKAEMKVEYHFQETTELSDGHCSLQALFGTTTSLNVTLNQTNKSNSLYFPEYRVSLVLPDFMKPPIKVRNITSSFTPLKLFQ